MKEQKVLFLNSKGQKLVGVVHIPDGDRPFPIVVFAHGMGSGKEGTAKRYSEDLCERGIVALRFDMAGCGESDGKMTEVTPLTGANDLKSALDFVETLAYIDKGKIGVIGSSYGGNVALFVATQDKRIKVLGFKSPVSDYPPVREMQVGEKGMEEWKKEGVRTIDGKYTLSYKFYEDSKETIIYPLAGKIKASTIIVHGSKDSLVPIEQSKKTFELLTCEKKLEIIEGGDHSFKKPEQAENYEKAKKLIVDWMVEHLK
jgi:hypothetical protein